MLSRLVGLVRDMAISSFGANRATSAFILAFQIPNLFRRLFGEGALAGSFVPVFSDVNERDGFAKASRLFANAMGLLSLVLGGLLILSYLILLIWRFGWPGEWDRQLLILLLSITMPFMATICLLAMGAAALNCKGHFAYPALAPILLNLCIIAAAWGVAPMLKNLDDQLIAISLSIPVAGVLQLAGVLWLLKRNGFSLRPTLRPIEPGIKPMWQMMLPMLIGLGFLQISPFFDMAIIWVLTNIPEAPTICLFGQEWTKPLSEAAQMQVYTAQRLYQLPMGVLAISLGVAVFPLLSRYAARNDHENFRHSITRAIRLSMFEGIAAGVGLFALAKPIMILLFVRRNFTEADAIGSAYILKMYALGMWAYCTYQIFSRAFFAIKQPKTPLKVSCVMVLVNVLLVCSLVWIPPLRAGAFGLATALTTAITVLILATILHRRIGGWGGREIVISLARSLIASGAMAGVILLLRHHLETRNASSGLVVAVCLPAGTIALFLTAWILRAPEPGEFLGAVKKKSLPAEADGKSL